MEEEIEKYSEFLNKIRDYNGEISDFGYDSMATINEIFNPDSQPWMILKKDGKKETYKGYKEINEKLEELWTYLKK